MSVDWAFVGGHSTCLSSEESTLHLLTFNTLSIRLQPRSLRAFVGRHSSVGIRLWDSTKESVHLSMGILGSPMVVDHLCLGIDLLVGFNLLLCIRA